MAPFQVKVKWEGRECSDFGRHTVSSGSLTLQLYHLRTRFGRSRSGLSLAKDAPCSQVAVRDLQASQHKLGSHADSYVLSVSSPVVRTVRHCPSRVVFISCRAKVGQWMLEGLETMRNRQMAGDKLARQVPHSLGQCGTLFGQLNKPELSEPIPFHVKLLFRRAASGASQAIFTFDSPATAQIGFDVAREWSVPVSTEFDPRGWRMCMLRWFRP